MEDVKPIILLTAQAVRKVLEEEFPNRPLLENCCQRACIIISSVLKKQKIKSSIINGKVSGYEHMWIELLYDKKRLLLDVTLTQFFPDASTIIFGEAKIIKKKYSYFKLWNFPIDKSHIAPQQTRISRAKILMREKQKEKLMQ